MEKIKIEGFNVVGLAIRTTNENGQSSKDIPALWNRFMSEGTLAKIPNKTSQDVYCVYTAYEKDYTKPYTTLLGCKVTNLEAVPAGMVGKHFDAAEYTTRIVTGNIMEGVVFSEWTKIWNSDLKRTYKADFEVYGEQAADPKNATVEIFVGIS